MPKLDQLTPHEQLLADEVSADPEFREEWDATALARAVAIEVIRYRARHDLSQADLAEQLGMRQPHIARLEAGETNPSLDTLIRLAGALDVELAIDIAPSHRRARLITTRARTGARLRRFRRGDVEVVIAAA